MKTEQQIRDKTKEHEEKINELLITKGPLWDDVLVQSIENYLLARKALLWVLSDDNLLPRGSDDFERKVKYEITCYESTKIF